MKNKYLKFILAAMLCAALALCASGCGKDEGLASESSSESSVSESSAPASSESSSDTVIVVGGESYSDVSSVHTSSSSVSSEESSAPETSESQSQAPSGDVESADEMKEYFKTAVFLGNSRTQGLQLYTGLTETTFLAERSMTVRQYDEKDYFTLKNGNKGNAIQVLKENTYKSVYIMYGLNEIGWPNSNVFFNAYRALIDEVKAAQPGAVIYIQSILPVSKEKSEKDEYVNNPRIDAYNETLRQIADEKGVKYIDLNSHFKDSEGHLPADVSTDGIHFGPKSCNKWLEILYNNR